MDDKTLNQAKTAGTILAAIIIIFLVVKIGGALINLFSSIGQGLNISDTDEEKDNQKFITDIENSGIDKNYWSQNYYKLVQSKLTPKEVLALSKSANLQDIAKQIYDSIGLLYDNPAQTIGAIKKLKNKVQISQLAEKFNQMYQRDLLAFLNEKLDTNDQQKILQQIFNYTNSLKVGNQLK